MACFAAAILVSTPAYALFAKLTTKLVGINIDGAIPTGTASVDQSNLPTIPALLAVGVSKVNLADGTVLSVNLSDCPWFGPVAYLNIVDGSARIRTSLPLTCQTGRLSSITIVDQTGAVLLQGGNPWKI
jgi:hypothetical protein